MSEDKLKTLKEIPKISDYINQMDYIDIKDLKSESIKWVKFYEKLGKVSALDIIKKQKESFGKEGEQVFNNENEMWVTAKIIAFLNFFNLSEQDLK